jgi:hypothetical protein
MALFTPATNTQAFLKAGLMGFAGSGKTYTATKLAIGLVQLMKDLKMPLGEKPALFLDTETGSDWVAPQFVEAGIPLHAAKTRAFVDLKEALREAEQDASVLLIDSITHFWRDLTESYARKKNRQRGLEFQDWAVLKQQWGEFTDLFVNSNLHIILCGRAGYEYDFFEQESGKKELQKTGVKMKAESDTGYEPSILIHMERDMDIKTMTVQRVAHILKDRADRLDGMSIPNPTFNDFRPHIEFLALGGDQFGVDTTRNSEGLFDRDGRSAWQWREEQREITLDRIKALLIQEGLDGTSTDAKKARVELLNRHFGTPSWREVESFRLDDMRTGYDAMHVALRGCLPNGEKPPGAAEAPANGAGEGSPPDNAAPAAETASEGPAPDGPAVAVATPAAAVANPEPAMTTPASKRGTQKEASRGIR